MATDSESLVLETLAMETNPTHLPLMELENALAKRDSQVMERTLQHVLRLFDMTVAEEDPGSIDTFRKSLAQMIESAPELIRNREIQ